MCFDLKNIKRIKSTSSLSCFFLYRMNFQTFWTLLKFIKPQHREHKGGCTQISISKMLGMTLSYPGLQTMICHLAIQFGVTTDAFIHCTEMIMKVLMDHY